ncbi:MAG: nicotinate-nucleotide diphosphorylase (carboxylating), partial [Candidatus Thorarchaeota archaeon]
MNSPPPEVIESLRYFLREDIRSGDLTTKILGTHDKPGVGTIFAKSRSVLAGVEEVIAIAKLTGLSHEVLEFEGNWVGPKQPVLRLQGPAKTLLQVERLCLNLIMRMSGAATK